MRCTLGQDCFVQNHVDRDPGAGAVDFTCGSLTYNGHDGTDIRLADRAAMVRGVEVVAAAPGTVAGARDGEPDVGRGAAARAGRECGNGVRIVGADGWSQLYCHLKSGTIRVAEGDRVEAGTPLGQIGLSGRTEFPHLHFVVRDPHGRVFDPFDARQDNEACALKDRRTLWRDLDAHDYQPGGALAAGFLDRMPEYREIQAGDAGVATLPADAPAILFWAHFFGLRDGDRIVLEIHGPDGGILAKIGHRMTRARATQFRAVGKRGQNTWPPGVYTGLSHLIRDGAIVAETEARVTVE